MTYELGTNAEGRTQAKRVSFSDERVPSTYSSLHSNGLLMLAAAFLFFISAATLAGKLPLVVLGIYLIVSSVTFFAYALDKSAAKYNRWRIQESTLHLFALLGGWPGALTAQRLFRHKSKKQSFQIVFWITVVLNCGALGWLFSRSGVLVLRSVLGSV